MQAQLCPVCQGIGYVASGFYNRTPGVETWTSYSTIPEMCRSCGGKGYVVIGDEGILVHSVEAAYFANEIAQNMKNRCPSCGGDRNDPGGTGCRKGDHYGNYC